MPWIPELWTVPELERVWEKDPQHSPAPMTASPSLATRLATAPGLIRPGGGCFDGERTPIQPLAVESAFADPHLLRDLGARGARVARDVGTDVIVGAETAGVPLAAAVALAGELPFAFVRKPGYHGHEAHEPRVRGASVADLRVLLVDDAVSSGASVERFSAALADVGAEVAGVFVVVDMRDVAPNVADVACALPIAAATTYLELLDVATANAVLEPDVRDLSVQAMVQHWTADDPRWQQLPLVR